MRRAAHDVVKLPIEFCFILSRVFSLKVATFCSNPFENVILIFLNPFNIFFCDTLYFVRFLVLQKSPTRNINNKMILIKIIFDHDSPRCSPK